LTPEIEKIISSQCIGTYLKAAGFDRDRALALYAWNMKISASFLPLLSSVEICLRNLIVNRLVAAHGPDWWTDGTFVTLLGKRGKGIVKRAEKDITARGRVPDSGMMTAELSFGFWENMLLPKYEAALWSQLHSHFPNLSKQIDLSGLRSGCLHVRELRNRISHHEPIFQRDHLRDYSLCLTFIGWLSTDKAAWVKSICDVPAIVRLKP
jgi:Abi-like protein